MDRDKLAIHLRTIRTLARNNIADGIKPDYYQGAFDAAGLLSQLCDIDLNELGLKK